MVSVGGLAPCRDTGSGDLPGQGFETLCGLRRAELSRKNGWTDEYGRIYLYYPICEVVELLHCGRQKAVNTLRELQYAELIEIKKQGCGKPNCIYPKSYEAVSNTDFKKSGFGTPEG